MKENSKNIDNQFKEKLFDSAVVPPSSIWANLEEKLPNEPKNKKRIIWVKRSLAAAAILGGFFLGIAQLFTDNKTTFKDQIVSNNRKASIESESNQIYQTEEETSIIIQTISQDNYYRNDGEIKSITTNHYPKTTTIANNKVEERENVDLSILNRIEAILFTSQTREMEHDLKMYCLHHQADRSIIERNLAFMQTEKKEKKHHSREWDILAQISPTTTHEGNTGNDTSYDSFSSSVNLNEEFERSIGGSVLVGLKLNPKLRIRSGLTYASIKQKSGSSSNVFSNSKDFKINSTNENKGITVKSSLGKVLIARTESQILKSTEADYYLDDNASVITSSQLNQSFNYLEVPIEVGYSLVDKKINIEVMGGVGTNFLINNIANAFENGSKIGSGETSDMRSVVYTGNLGINFGYEFIPQFSFHLAPQMEYYLSSISSSSNVASHPFSVGLQAGISFRFE